MEKQEALLSALSKLITDNMGAESGRLFYEFHKYETDTDTIITGAKALLYDFMGANMAEKNLAEVMQAV